MLQLKEYQKNYPGFSLCCSLEVPPGRITGIIGQNGAGKSTVFKSVLGLIHPDGGEVLWRGKDVRTLTAAEKCDFGVALADSSFSGYLNVRDVTAILRAMYPAFREDFFRSKCEDLHLPFDKPIRTFSTGMRAKLKVLAAVSHNASLLLLDEPTAGLDVLAREETLSLLRHYVAEDERRSILISSHISTDLEGLCDDLYLIDRGRILLHEDTDRILDGYAVLKVPEDRYATLDKSYILRRKKESYGYALLTNERRFYQENYPDLVSEKCTLDDCMTLLILGEEPV